MKSYDEDFKKMIVELYEKGSSLGKIAKDYDISKTSVRNWVAQYQSIQKPDGNSITLAEMKKIEKEMARLREENEVLKKCISIFSKK